MNTTFTPCNLYTVQCVTNGGLKLRYDERTGWEDEDKYPSNLDYVRYGRVYTRVRDAYEELHRVIKDTVRKVGVRRVNIVMMYRDANMKERSTSIISYSNEDSEVLGGYPDASRFDRMFCDTSVKCRDTDGVTMLTVFDDDGFSESTADVIFAEDKEV